MPPKAKKIKRKTHWRGRPAGLKHGVRQLGDQHFDRTICGAKVTDDFDAVGTRLKKADIKCQKCVRWDEAGLGVGGENVKATGGDKVKLESAA